MSDKEIREEFKKRNFKDAIYDELDQFLNARTAFLKNNDEKVNMLIWYEVIYTSLKSIWVAGGISEADFWYLTNMLGNDDIIEPGDEKE